MTDKTYKYKGKHLKWLSVILSYSLLTLKYNYQNELTYADRGNSVKKRILISKTKPFLAEM